MTLGQNSNIQSLILFSNILQLPAIEAILRENAQNSRRSPINVLAICPTRELATQVATEAKMLTTFQRGLGVQVVIGGTNVSTETRRLEKSPCQVSEFSLPARLFMMRKVVKEP